MVKRAVLTTKQKIGVYNLLREHTHDGAKEGTVAYETGWDDVRVAKECGDPDVNAKHVARLRSQMLGLLYIHPGKGNGKGGGKTNNLRLAHLEDAFNALCDKIGEPSFKL